MNELTTKPIEPMIFETVTEHRGRTLYEQQSRHKQATGHNQAGKLQVREEEIKIVGAGIRQRRIIVYQECLDCSGVKLKVFDDAGPPTREHLETLDKNGLLAKAKIRYLPGNKQTNKTKLIDTILDSY